MTRAVRVKQVTLYKIWKMTAYEIKLARMMCKTIDDYNARITRFVDLHRFFEKRITEDTMRIAPLDYLKMIKEIRKWPYTNFKTFYDNYEWPKWYDYTPKDMSK